MIITPAPGAPSGRAPPSLQEPQGRSTHRAGDPLKIRPTLSRRLRPPLDALADSSGLRLMERFAAVRLLHTGRDLVATHSAAPRRTLVAMGGVEFGPGLPPKDPGTAGDAIQVASIALGDTTRAVLSATRDQIVGFAPLPGSDKEVERVAGEYAVFRPGDPAPVVLTGADATERAIKTLAAPPYVLHLATHGYYLKTGSIEGRPLLQSGIALAGANRALIGENGPDGENGILHALEAQNLNLYGTELVVLSACNTGQGAYDYSEGLEGPPRALYLAGAKNVMVALWPIDDRLTIPFMSRFYEEWLSHPGVTPAEALQNTKLRYINSNNPAERDPATWAPFVLYEG